MRSSTSTRTKVMPIEGEEPLNIHIPICDQDVQSISQFGVGVNSRFSSRGVTAHSMGKRARHHNQWARCHSQPTAGNGSEESSQSLNSHGIESHLTDGYVLPRNVARCLPRCVRYRDDPRWDCENRRWDWLRHAEGPPRRQRPRGLGGAVSRFGLADGHSRRRQGLTIPPL